MNSTRQSNDGKTVSDGLDLSKLVELTSIASGRVSSLQATADELASQIAFTRQMIQSHLAGGSIDSHLALVGAGRRLASMLADDREAING